MFNLCMRPWIRFLRLPAVFTVPGDVLLGAALAGHPFSFRSVLAVCAAYLFGMALNDVVDLPADRINRPERPLPQGEISRNWAIAVCGLLALAAWISLPTGSLAGLLLLIVLYTRIKQVQLWAGAGLMAACRALAVWIGAGGSAAPDVLLGGVLGLWMLIILLITLLADAEGKPRAVIQPKVRLLTLCWLAAPVSALGMGQPPFWIFLPWALLAALALQNFRLIRDQGEMQGRNTGSWLAMLIPLQSVFIMACGHTAMGLGVLALWPCLQWSLRKMRIS